MAYCGRFLLYYGHSALCDFDRVQVDDPCRSFLVRFGLFNQTAFLAEKGLGNLVASGVKVLVLAVVGIGTTRFGQFTQ
jgi:hypothetical protein